MVPLESNYVGRKYVIKAGVIEIPIKFLNPRCRYTVKVKVKVKQSRCRPGVAQRVPGS
jgi:hypothetical protein